MLIQNLEKRKLITPPSWLADNTSYLCMMGSRAYATEIKEDTDYDIYGWAIPPKVYIFPHSGGYIPDFSEERPTFEQFQQHHIEDKDADKEYDITVFNIVKYFNLLMENNPNVLESAFVPQNCILHSSNVAGLLRENRHIFLHKGLYYKYKGYAYSQLHKMSGHERTGKRKELYEAYGFDTKFASHVVRLLQYCRQLLMTEDLDLQQNKEHIKAIKRGEVKEQEVRDWAAAQEKELEKCYQDSKLPERPRKAEIKALLLNILEQHYGSLSADIVNPDKYQVAFNEVVEIVRKYQ